MKIEKQTKTKFIWSQAQIIDNKIDDEIIRKMIIIYKVALIQFKQELEENNERLKNQSKFTKRLWGTFSTKYKTFCMEKTKLDN